jgi:hypothetical protein
MFGSLHLLLCIFQFNKQARSHMKNHAITVIADWKNDCMEESSFDSLLLLAFLHITAAVRCLHAYSLLNFSSRVKLTLPPSNPLFAQTSSALAVEKGRKQLWRESKREGGSEGGRENCKPTQTERAGRQ